MRNALMDPVPDRDPPSPSLWLLRGRYTVAEVIPRRDSTCIRGICFETPVQADALLQSLRRTRALPRPFCALISLEVPFDPDRLLHLLLFFHRNEFIIQSRLVPVPHFLCTLE